MKEEARGERETMKKHAAYLMMTTVLQKNKGKQGQ